VQASAAVLGFFVVPRLVGKSPKELQKELDRRLNRRFNDAVIDVKKDSDSDIDAGYDELDKDLRDFDRILRNRRR
jgi:hypothetical protein